MATPPVFRAGVAARGNSTTGSLTIPGTVQNGDWGMIVSATNDGMGSPSTPSGWSVLVATTSIVAKQRFTVFVKQFATGDANPSCTWGVASNYALAGAWWSNANGFGTPGTLGSTGSGTTSTAAAITTTSDQNLAVNIFTHFNGSGGGATAATITPDATMKFETYSASTFNHGIWIGEITKATAGATNTQTATWNLAGTGMAGMQVALLPALPAQVWVPTTDTGATVAGWTKVPGGAASIAAVLADSDPTSYIESGTNPTSLVYQTPTFSVAVPADLTTAKVKVSGLMPTGTSGSRLIQLYQSATLIKQSTISLTAVNVETIVTLSSIEAASITVTTGNWNNLSIKVTDTAS